MLVQGRCCVVLGSAHGCASLVGSAYDVILTGRVPVGGWRCPQRGAYARDRARLGRGLRGPDTTVFRVEGSRSPDCGGDDLGRVQAAMSNTVPALERANV